MRNTLKSYFVQVMDRLQVALQPAVTNLRASWILPDGYDVIYTPEHIPPLFNGDRLTLYAILARRKDIEAASNGRISRRSSSESVKEFWFEVYSHLQSCFPSLKVFQPPSRLCPCVLKVILFR